MESFCSISMFAMKLKIYENFLVTVSPSAMNLHSVSDTFVPRGHLQTPFLQIEKNKQSVVSLQTPPEIFTMISVCRDGGVASVSGSVSWYAVISLSELESTLISDANISLVTISLKSRVTVGVEDGA